MPTLPEYEATRRERLDSVGPVPRAQLLHVLLLPHLERATTIGELWASPKTRSLAELLIDAEEDRMLRAELVGMLRESERRTLGLMAALWDSKRLAYCLYNHQTTHLCAHNQLKRGMRRCNLRTLQRDSRNIRAVR